ncbi:DUF4259 domain-containing protein [Hymenobacter sp. BT175]|uniref:DUF4259 domain-containing protein n=1 Tax=Hymenobacter translucens TaxID=2886507 RepID=UPI001D0EF186|nr:DUF4259 domain-containing protein [Hymenobacter translucens]MCC2544829.1 DUF4259 domain-containing protein [Hymenobacter translucens]
MSAWGNFNFDNDDATDFAGDFMERPSEVQLLEALITAAEGENLEADEASQALAAAEIVAAWHGKPGSDFLPGLFSAIQHLDVSDEDELLDLARRAVQAVLQGSELVELWTENGELASWQAAQRDLLTRLEA